MTNAPKNSGSNLRHTTERLLDLGAHQPKVRRGVRAMWSRNAKLEILYDWASLRRRELVLIKEFKRW